MQPGFAAACLVALLVAAACSIATTPSPPSIAGGNLTVYAASSLTGPFKDLAAACMTASGASITLSFDSSSALEAQIEQGAPADILASADATNPQKLVTAGLADGSPVSFAGNRLTIIVPAGAAGPVTSAADLGRPGIKVIGAGDAVPITKYATTLIENLARQPGYPSNFATAVAANTASREDNVKAVVSKIELGEGDAAIVYVTDAKASPKVRTIDVPSAANVAVTYAAVVVKGTRVPAAAQAFLRWLRGADAQAILARFGFLPPGPDPLDDGPAGSANHDLATYRICTP